MFKRAAERVFVPPPDNKEEDKMTVKDVIKETARLVGDEEFYSALADETGEASDETAKKTQIMLKCYNDTLFEIATEVLPLETEEEVELGVVKFDSLSAFPQKINKIRKDGYSVKFYVGVNYFETDERGAGIVTYEKMPTEKTVDDDFEYDKTVIGKTIFCYGMAAEYCLITGRFSETSNWESRYRNALSAVTPKKGRYGNIKSGKVW